MVSLSRSANMNVGGATFFSESTVEEREFLQPILESFGVFKPLRTIVAFGVHLLAFSALEIALLFLTICHIDEEYRCREYFTIIYSHVGLWFLTLVVDQIARVRHYNLRMNGYLEFYKRTQVHHQLPIYVVSLWTAVILLLQALMQHYYPDDFIDRCVKKQFLSPMSYMCLIISVEFCVVLAVSVNYIVQVFKFNKLKPPPDVQKEEWTACSSAETFAQGEIGYRQMGDKVYDFLEKQADLIRHLKDHNARLGEKLMVVNAQLQARSRSSPAM